MTELSEAKEGDLKVDNIETATPEYYAWITNHLLTPLRTPTVDTSEKQQDLGKVNTSQAKIPENDMETDNVSPQTFEVVSAAVFRLYCWCSFVENEHFWPLSQNAQKSQTPNGAVQTFNIGQQSSESHTTPINDASDKLPIHPLAPQRPQEEFWNGMRSAENGASHSTV